MGKSENAKIDFIKEKIEELKVLHLEFSKKLNELEAEKNKQISAIMEEEDKRKAQEARQELKQ